MKPHISLPAGFVRALPRRLPYTLSTTLPRPDFSTVGWGTVLLSLIGAGIVHLLATLSVPLLAGGAVNALRASLPANTMKLLPRQAPGAHTLPFLSPDMGYAMCRYDLAALPVAVRAVLPDAGWSVALYTPQGDNFYAVPANETKRTDVAFVIVPASDRLFNITPGVRRADVDAAQVTSPQREGLVVVRGPRRGLAYDAEMTAALALATCQPVQR